MSLRERFERYPKIELHLHLEGAIPPGAFWQLLGKYGGDPSVPSREALDSRFAYRDFPHFIETWIWKNGFLREYEDFAFIAEEVARDLARQRILYAEVFFSPGDFGRFGLEAGRIAEAVRQGLDKVPAIQVALVADLVRDFGPQRAAATLAEVHEARGCGIAGIGIGGSEHEFPPEDFADVYRRARDLGFRTSAHAGEAAGPESVWAAIRALAVDRIGHGTRAAEDPKLLDYLTERRLPLELCVLSNLRTGVVASVAAHPARLYFERGIPISINTDDPRMFGCSLADEYLALHDQLGFTPQEIRSVIMDSVETSWLPPLEKNDLRRRLQQEFARLEGQTPGA